MTLPEQGRAPREPILRVPAAVVALIALLAAAHAARVFSSAAVSDHILNTYALDPAVYTAPAGTVGWFEYVVPLFSHMLLHADLTHLGVNCVWLLAFGPVVARRFGGAAFFVFFIICGIAGAAAFVAMDWGQNVGAIGASGAISGLMGCAIRMMRITAPGQDVSAQPLAPLWSSQVLLFSAVWMGVNLVTGLFGGILTGSGDAIAWQDHTGGYLAGLLLAAPFEYFVGPTAVLRRRGA